MWWIEECPGFQDDIAQVAANDAARYFKIFPPSDVMRNVLWRDGGWDVA